MKFNQKDPARNAYMLGGLLGNNGYDRWWHSFTGTEESTGEERAFFVEYYLCNPGLALDYPVFGQHPLNKRSGVRPSYVMVGVGCWGPGQLQVRRYFPWKDVRVGVGVPFGVVAGDCSATDTRLSGSVDVSEEYARKHPECMTDAGKVEWDLEVRKVVAFNAGYRTGPAARRMRASQALWHAEGMKTRYKGYVVLNGRRFDVDPTTSYGYADKNWGSKLPDPRIWLASSHLVSNVTGKKLEDSAFGIVGGCAGGFGAQGGKGLTGGLYYEGEEFEFNPSKLWTGAKTSMEAAATDDAFEWQVSMESYKAALQLDVSCIKKDMLLTRQEDPRGIMTREGLWSGGNATGRLQVWRKQGLERQLVDDIAVYSMGCEYGARG